MKHNKNVREFLLEIWISVFIFITKTSLNRLKIYYHNGASIFNYPEANWNMVPFPAQKGDVFNADNLATVNRHQFLQAKKFIDARNAAESRWGDPGTVRDISWRLHVMLWASGLGLKNPCAKDALFVECGTGRGYMAAGICEYHEFNKNSPLFYLIDTFTPYLTSTDGKTISNPAHFAYSDGDEEVKNYFSRYGNIRLIKGMIPDALKNLPNKPICFLHLDLNHADAEEAALKYLEDRFIPGTVIIFDDYGGPGGHDQAKVHEKFANSVNKDLLVLPTGQAVIIW